MMKGFSKPGVFLGAGDDYSASKAIIFGAPMDYTVSYRPGSRFAPERIRSASLLLEEYSPYFNKSLDEISYFDAGDLLLPFGNVRKSLAIIHAAASKFFKDNKFPLMLGGEHLVSLPVIQAAQEAFCGLKLIQFDAHADLRRDYLGEADSHATVIRKAAELIGGKNVFQLGIRSGTKEEFAYADANTNLFFNQIGEALDSVVSMCGNDPVYVTLDIDVLDPAFAPGTGTPDAGGATVNEIINAFKILAGLNIIGFDLVEVAPPYDTAEITAIAAAKLLRESLLGFIR